MWKLKHQRADKGFTLIELFVTIGIIGILAQVIAGTPPLGQAHYDTVMAAQE